MTQPQLQVSIPGADAPLNLDAATITAMQRSVCSNLTHAMGEARVVVDHLPVADTGALYALSALLEEAAAAVEQMIALAPPTDQQAGMVAAFDGVGVLAGGSARCRSTLMPVLGEGRINGTPAPGELHAPDFTGAERVVADAHLARTHPHGLS